MTMHAHHPGSTDPMSNRTGPVRLVVETDFFSDVDDVGALAVAHALADRGEVELAAVSINTPSRYGVTAVASVNAFCGRPEVPIGTFPVQDDSLADLEYAKFLSEAFPAPVPGGSADAVSVLRRVLAGSPDGSVVIASIGFFGNLVALLDSAPDEVSPHAGTDLVARKVSRAFVMGGTYPAGTEFNMASYPHEAGRFVDDWPTPVDFLGFEIGADVITGAGFSAREIASSPVAAAYDRYSGSAGRSSWDLLLVDLAVRGPRDLYALSERGTVRVTSTGENTFEADPAGRHRYVTRLVSAQALAESVEPLLRAAGNNEQGEG